MKIGSFPELVNDRAARAVAALVVALALFALWSQNLIAVLFLLYGFLARVLYGPRIDLFARLSIHVLVPLLRLGDRPVPGPPKRFAQFIGLCFSAAALAFLLLGMTLPFQISVGTLAFFAFLESALGFCAGCFAFYQLMRVGLLPPQVCENYNRLSAAAGSL